MYKANAAQFNKPHIGGEKWERIYAIRGLHEAAHKYIADKSRFDSIVIGNVPIVTLWDFIATCYDDTLRLDRIEIDFDSILDDWEKKLSACRIK